MLKMSKIMSIKQNARFQRLYKKGDSAVLKTFVIYLKKRNDDMFKIVGLGSAHSIASGLQYEVNYTRSEIDHGGNPVVDGHLTYVRIFIKNITI